MHDAPTDENRSASLAPGRAGMTALRSNWASSGGERLQLLVDAIRDHSIYLLDPAGRVATWNAGAEFNKGYLADEVIGRHFSCFFTALDVAAGAPDRILADAEREGRIELQAWRVRKDGSRFWAHVVVNAIRDDTGALVGFAKTTRDLTEVKRHQDELRASEQRFRSAMEHSPVGMALVGLDGRWLQVNKAVCELLGYTPEALAELTFQQITHPDDLENDLQLVADLLAGRVDNFRLEKRYIRRDGSTVWGMLAVSLVRDADGAPQHFISQVQDIDHLKLIEAQLHEQRDRLQVTLYSIGDGVITTDVDGRIEFMNPVAETMTGWNLEEVIGLPHGRVFNIIHADTDETVESPVTVCLAERRTFYLHDRSVLVRRNGTRCDIQDSAAPIRALDGRLIGAILVFQDSTKVRSTQRELEFKAMHDVLTGLPNRRKFEGVLADALHEAQRIDVEHALCFIDLDRFKSVNDSAGHAAGDMLLRAVTQVLSRSVRAGDLVARLGGDEFAVILFRCPLDKALSILTVASEALAALQFPWEGAVHTITASIGLTRIGAGSDSIAGAMREADSACYAAKRKGRNSVCVYAGDPVERGVQHRGLAMAEEIRLALSDGRFTIDLQRIAALGDDDARHHEALVRMHDSHGERIAPERFLDAAEQHGLLVDIDRWVVEELLDRRADELVAIDGLQLGINLSAASLNDEAFLVALGGIVEKSVLPAGSLCFEISEATLSSNLLAATSAIERIRSFGCAIALDDFGIGFSSFGFLRTFRVDFLKIHGSFIGNLARNAVDLAIVRSISAIAHEIGARTVAKCVEHDDGLDALRSIGVDFAQGFAIARPRELDELLRENAESATRRMRAAAP